MSSTISEAQRVFIRYRNGYETDLAVVSRLSHSKNALVNLNELLGIIKSFPHWQEDSKLKNLKKTVKLHIKNNFSASSTPKKLERAASCAISSRVIDNRLTLLPVDIWATVGNKLSGKEHVNFTATCKQAHSMSSEILANNARKLSIGLSNLLQDGNEAKIMDFLKNCKESRYENTPLSLTIRSAFPRQNICLYEIQKKFPNLVTLEVAKKDICDKELEILLASCPRITTLKLSNCTSLTAHALNDLKKHPQLQHLELQGIQLDDLGLHAICKACSSLRVLKIKGCGSLTPTALLTAHLPHCIQIYEHDGIQQDATNKDLANRLLEASPDNALLLLFVANLEENFETPRALTLMEKAVKIYPALHSIQITLASCYFMKLDSFVFDKKLSEEWLTKLDMCTQKAYAIDPNDINSVKLRLFYCIQSKKNREALSLLEQNKDKMEANESVLLKAFLLMREGDGIKRDFKQAEELLKTINSETASGVKLSLALIYAAGGDGVPADREVAKNLFEYVMQEDPTFIMTFKQLLLAAEFSLPFAQLGKLILDDPELGKTRKNEIKSLFTLLLQIDPNPHSAELKDVILSCSLLA